MRIDNMKTRGFTLAELMGVIIIIAFLLIFALPNIINFVKSSNKKIGDITLDLIYSASKDYVNENKNEFPKVEENIYCIPLRDLVDDGKLKSPIKLSSNSEDITDTMQVEVIYDEKFKYELKDNCVERKASD